jgi:hypothetical protein
MSITNVYGRVLQNKRLSTVRGLGAILAPWTRPADWLALPSIVSTDQKFVGLHAVYPDSNFLALSAAGNYTVDWGDGSAPENVASGVVAYRTYNYTNAAFDGTLTERGYKQAIVTVTPQSGQNLTTLNLHRIHNQSGLNLYASGFLDIAIAGSLITSLLIGSQTAGSSTQVISFRDLEQVNILSVAITSASYLFNGCSSLGNITASTGTVTNFNYMFNNCYSLQTIPLLNTASGTNFSSMFNNCYSLQTIPLLNTASGTNFSSMFYACYSLQTIPLLNTASGTNFNSMFYLCYSLQTIPLLNTAAGTNFTYMFNACYSLQTIPLLNTAAGTNFTAMFYACSSLQTIPLLNTASGTNFTQMFYACSSLQTIPLLNTAAGTNFTSMFYNCYSLQTIPLLNTAAGTDFSTMFNLCYSLQTGTISGPRYALSYASCKLSQSALQAIIDNLGTSNTTGLAFTISTNWGAVTPVSLSGNTTAGSLTVTMASTAGIVVGMQVTGVGTPSTTAIAVTFTDAGDTVNLAAHGLSNNDEVSFATIVTTTGITINKIYYVVGAAANTFQVALTSGGAAINLVTDGSGTLRYKATVAVIDPDVSVTLSRPATSTGTNTLAYRDLKTNTALLKGWAVTG